MTSALTDIPIIIKHRFTAFFILIALHILLSACGGSNVGKQNDQKDPEANLSIIGLIADTSNNQKVYTARANNELTLTAKDSVALDSPIITYTWEQTGGEEIAFTRRAADNIVFTTPNVSVNSTLTFAVTIVDGNENSSHTEVSINVEPIDDVNLFLASPEAPQGRLKVKAALRGGESTGESEETITLEFVTIAHWRNQLGVMDNIIIRSEELNGIFPAGFNPEIDYDPLLTTKNPTLAIDIYALDIDDINRNFETSNAERQLDTGDINSAYIEIQINVIGSPTVDFELFTVDNDGLLINSNSVLTSPEETTETTNATNGALLQTWNNELSASIMAEKVLAALGLETSITANNYYVLIDPDANFSSLDNWLTYAGFDQDHTADNTDPNLANAIYFNNYDLGFARNTWLRQDPETGNVFSYVTNFPTVEAALKCQNDFSVFAMEYSDNPDFEGENEKIVKFYAFIPDTNTGKYMRTNTVNIDGRGEKAIPGVCTACHQSYAGDRQFTEVSEADLDAAFIPLDIDSFLYASAENPDLIEPTLNVSLFTQETLTTHSRETMEEELKEINNGILTTYQNNPDRHAAAIALLDGWYNIVEDDIESFTENLSKLDFSENRFNSDYIPDGWLGSEELYNGVFVRACRTCHTQLNNPELDFDSYDEFITSDNLISSIFEQGVMPLSQLTLDRFWIPFYASDTSAATQLRLHLENQGETVASAPGLPLPDFTINNNTPTSNDEVILDASPSAFAKSYTWELITPEGSESVLNNTTGLTSSFTPDIAEGIYEVILTITNKDDITATLTQVITAGDLVPAAECLIANTEFIDDETGILPNIPVVSLITNIGDGDLRIESVTDGNLGTVTIDEGAQTLTYQLTDFSGGIDIITYRLIDANGSLSTTSLDCSSTNENGFATIEIDTTMDVIPAPTNITSSLADDNTSLITVSWTAPQNADLDGYVFYVDGELLGSTGVTFFSYFGEPGTTYTFNVFSGIGIETSNPTSITVTTPSITPVNLQTNSISNTQIDLSWEAPEGFVTGYAIYRSDQEDLIDTISAEETSYSDINVESGTEYQYTVTALAFNEESTQSNLAIGATFPDTPSTPIGTAISNTEIDVSWTAINCTGEASYTLSTSGITDIPTANTFVTVSGLVNGIGYEFNVTAQCHNLTSDVSANSNAVFTLFTFPTNLTATSITSNQINLSWTPAFGVVDTYNIYQAGSFITSGASVGHGLSGFQPPGSQSEYAVSAVINGIESELSNTVIATTFPEALDAPTATFAPSEIGVEIDVMWSASTCTDETPIYTLITNEGSLDDEALVTTETSTTLTEFLNSGSYTFNVNVECHGLTSANSEASDPITIFSELIGPVEPVEPVESFNGLQ